MPPKLMAESTIRDEATKRLIIHEVKNEIAPYNSNHDDFRSTKIKSEIYARLAARLSISSAVFKATWKSIERRYKNEKKLVDGIEASGGSIADIYKPSWEFWDDLAFMSDPVILAIKSGNLDSHFAKIEAETHLQSSCSTKKVESKNQNIVISPKTPSTTVTMPRPSEKSENLVNSSEDPTYFSSLAVHTQHVSEEHKLKMRNEINNVVDKYAYHKKPQPASKYTHLQLPYNWPFLPCSTSSPQYYAGVKQEPTSPKRRSKRQISPSNSSDSGDSDDCVLVDAGPFKDIPQPAIKKEKKSKKKSRNGDLSLLMEQMKSMQEQQKILTEIVQQQQQSQMQMCQVSQAGAVSSSSVATKAKKKVKAVNSKSKTLSLQLKSVEQDKINASDKTPPVQLKSVEQDKINASDKTPPVQLKSVEQDKINLSEESLTDKVDDEDEGGASDKEN
ncbi:hypothetical protein TKK_0009459 [Trichogramma kaykai]|uniref:MADF domain-containing protein n=1 Tax=Trichogramma kaykai TaxID=54128 RepID=A0ABD2X0T0_9HYME